MTRSAADPLKKSERFRAHRHSLPAAQIAIERQAMRLRAQLRISEYVELSLEVAACCLPNVEVLGLRHVPGITLQHVVYFRTTAYRTFGAMACRIEDRTYIVFNDAHQPPTIRVNVMEEIFHILLGHEPDVLSLVAREGRHRTYCAEKERQAYGCAIAALVPYAALYAMLTRHTHIARIAEHFGVSVDVVHERIGATQMGDLMNAQFLQYSLAPEAIAG